MKVAVFGSWREPGSKDEEWGFKGGRDAFEAACRDVGRELARKRCTLVVESEKPEVADPHVVAGYVDYVESMGSNKATELRIDVAYARGQEQPFMDVSHDSGLVVYRQPVPAGYAGHQQWSNSHLVSLKHADAVLTIGGEQGTYLAGSAAIVARKSLVPIASFGGASARLLSDLDIAHTSAGNGDSTLLWELNGHPKHVVGSAMRLLFGSHKAIFISHAHRDEHLASAIVEAIESAFVLPANAIRCTSVPGYKLAAGTYVTDQLRQEIRTTEFLLGLVTPNSIQSKYVLFELGAAWGLGRRTFPLIACGVNHSDIPEQVRARHSLDLSNEKDCHQLLDELAASPVVGERKPTGKAEVADAVKRIVEFAQKDASG